MIEEVVMIEEVEEVLIEEEEVKEVVEDPVYLSKTKLEKKELSLDLKVLKKSFDIYFKILYYIMFNLNQNKQLS